jgi:hypothetical protein
MPHVFKALKNTVVRFRISYSFLSKEYCCGWMPLGQPAVMAKNDADIAKAKELAKGFIQENFKQAEALQLAIGNGSITLSIRNPLDKNEFDEYPSILNKGRLTRGALMCRPLFCRPLRGNRAC